MTLFLCITAALATGIAIGWLAMNAKATKTISAHEAEIKMLTREIELIGEQKRKDDEIRDRHYAEQLRIAREEVKNTTSELLKLRARELDQSNTSQMTAIIEPLKEKIKEMQQAMDNSREQYTRNAAALHQALEDIMKRTATIGDEAGKLAKALRHENKIQGNWGEAILSELLESQGLHEGIHYDVQSTLKDKNGRPVLN